MRQFTALFLMRNIVQTEIWCLEMGKQGGSWWRGGGGGVEFVDALHAVASSATITAKRIAKMMWMLV